MDIDIESERARSDRLGALALKASTGELGPAKQLGAMGPSNLGSLGSAALLAAARSGHEHCARALLPSADPMESSKSSDGRAAIWWAIHHGWEDFAVELAMASGSRANEKDRWGETPLMNAAKSGMAKLCLMLAKDAPPLQRDADGYTALMWACMGDQAVCASILASEQATHAKEKGGRCALEIAADCGADACCMALAGWAGPKELAKALRSRSIKQSTRGFLERQALAWSEKEAMAAEVASGQKASRKAPL